METTERLPTEQQQQQQSPHADESKQSHEPSPQSEAREEQHATVSAEEEKEETSSVASSSGVPPSRSPVSPATPSGASGAAARVAAARARSRSLTSNTPHGKAKGAGGAATLRPSRTSIGASVPSSGYGTTYSPAPAAAPSPASGLPSPSALQPTKYMGMQTGGRIEYLLPTRVPVASRATAASAAQRSMKSPKSDRLYKGFIAPGQHAPFDLRLKHPTVLGSTVAEPAGPTPFALAGSKSAAYDDSKVARISVTDTSTRVSAEKRSRSSLASSSPAALAAVLEEDIAARREARVQKLEAEAERVKEALWAASNEVERAQMLNEERRFVADLRSKVRAARRAREEAWKRQEIAQRRKENASLRAPEERLRKYESWWTRDQPAVPEASQGDERPLTPEQEEEKQEEKQDGVPRANTRQRTRFTVHPRGRPVDRWHGSGGGIEFPLLSADDPDSFAPLWTAHAEAPQSVPPASATADAPATMGLALVPVDSAAASSSSTGHRGTASVGGADQLGDAMASDATSGDDLTAEFAAAASSTAVSAHANDDSAAADQADPSSDGLPIDFTPAASASDDASPSASGHPRQLSGGVGGSHEAVGLSPGTQGADSGDEVRSLADDDAFAQAGDEHAAPAHSDRNAYDDAAEAEAGIDASAAAAAADSPPDDDPSAAQQQADDAYGDADAGADGDGDAPSDPVDVEAEGESQLPVDGSNPQDEENDAAWAEAEAEFDADMSRLSAGIGATKLPRKSGLFAAKPKPVSLVVVGTSSSGSRASGPSWLLHWNSKSKSKEEDMLNLSSMRDCVRGIEAGAFANNKDFAKKYASVESHCFSLTLADRSLDVVITDAEDAELFARVLSRILDPSDAFRVPRALDPSSPPPL